MKHWDLPEDWEIEAALPEYVDGEGDATRLFLADGTDRLVRARLRTVLERLARRHCRSLPLLRAWAKERTALAQTAPLAIASELVLVPFRARRPRIRGDAAMGVVNAMHAQLVRAEESSFPVAGASVRFGVRQLLQPIFARRKSCVKTSMQRPKLPYCAASSGRRHGIAPL